MKYLPFLVLIFCSLNAQDWSLGISTNIEQNVQEYLINANREIATYKNNFITYGIDTRLSYSIFQTGLSIKYGSKNYTDETIEIINSKSFDYFKLASERQIYSLRLEIPILVKLYENEFSKLYIGAAAGIKKIKIVDKSYVQRDSNSGNFKDELDKYVLLFDPKIEYQLRLYKSINIYAGINYSFHETNFHTKKEDNNSNIRVSETEYKYDFKGVFYSAGIYYTF